MTVGAKVVAICQFGGEFAYESDGSMSYIGGEAHAMDIERGMLFDELKSELTSMFDIDINTMSVKYFLPNNKRILITISSDRDLQRMVDYHANSAMMDVFILQKNNNRIIGNAPVGGDQNSKQQTPSTVDKISNWAIRFERTGADDNHEAAIVPCVDNGVQQIFAATATNNGVITAESSTTAICISATEDFRLQSSGVIDDVRNRGAEIVTTDLLTPMAEDVSPLNPSILWSDAITGLDQEFDTVKDFRDALLKYAIAKGFSYKFLKNDHDRVSAKCAAENCPWRIHGSRSARKKKFVIKKINDVHICEGGSSKDPRTKKHWLASIIKEKLRETPNYKPKDIVKDLLRDYGISLNYSQAWRGREVAQKELYNLHEEAYNHLPWFVEKIAESNPGSVALLSSSDDIKYRRVFVSFYASLYGFEHGCRPLLFLDRLPLRANNQWKILVAASVDGDDGIFPVAFAAVEAETYDSWVWFLIQLKDSVGTSRSITFVSNRQNGLDEAVPRVFENSYHCYCLLQLIEDFKGELARGSYSDQMNDAMVDNLRQAAHACSVEEFDSRINSIRHISTDAANWVMTSKPEHWSNAYFRGSRYDHMSCNILGPLNNWIPVKQESSVVLMIEVIRGKMEEMIVMRRDKSNTWEGTLTPTMEQKLQKEMLKAPMLSVLCSSDSVFEVRGNAVYVVNIQNLDCTCRRWQMTGLPCMHAMAVCDRIHRNHYDFCSGYLTIDSYRLSYSESIHPISDMEHVSSIFGANLYPPLPNRPPSRIKRKRIDPNKIGIRPLHCSRCNGSGHNRATCQAPL